MVGSSFGRGSRFASECLPLGEGLLQGFGRGILPLHFVVGGEKNDASCVG